jgi:hypothetical protein
MLIYCRSILAILAWVILLNGIVVSQVPVFENVDPTVSQLEVIRGSGDPDYSGDLNVNIPLMTVPGRGGLNFNINLQYVHGNGVPASESASWVGLGWNLNMYQITCSPTYDPDIASSGSLLSDDKDMYYLSYPGGATPFRKFADDWTPLNWSAIKIEASILTTPGGNNPDQDYERFVVTDLDGTRYVFGHKLKMESQNQLSNHCIPNSGSVQCAHTNGHPYFYVFKLTAILGPNYVDAGGDAYVPGDVGTDSGSWIKLDYWDPITITADGSIIQMEASFLKTITTPTHQASFTLTSSYNNAIIYRGLQKENLPSLDKIQLKKLGGTLIREVDFTTSESFGWVKENSGPVNLTITSIIPAAFHTASSDVVFAWIASRYMARIRKRASRHIPLHIMASQPIWQIMLHAGSILGDLLLRLTRRVTLIKIRPIQIAIIVGC